MKRIKSLIHSSRFSHSRLLYTQGCGVFGALGHGDNLSDEILFRKVALSGSDHDINIKQVSSGWAHSAAVTSEGKLVMFGRPYDDLAIKTINRIKSISPMAARFYGLISSRFGGHDEVSYGIPQFVDGIDDVISAHCSIGLTVSLTKGGDLYSFGQDKWGQCGIGSTSKEYVFGPSKVLLGPVKSVDVGLSHCIALSECSSIIYTWGKGTEGQLGVGPMKITEYPIAVKSLKGSFLHVSAGFYHSAAVSSTGLLYVWGKGMASVLRRGSQTGDKSAVKYFDNQMTPREIRMPGGRKAVHVCCSNFTVVIRCCDDSLWAMGIGEFDRSAVCTPVRVQQAVPENEIIAAGSGSDGFYNINTSDLSRKIIMKKEKTSHDLPRDILNSRLDSHFLNEMLEQPHRVDKNDVDSIIMNDDNVVRTPPAHLCVGSVMKKGFQRVIILSPSSQGLMTSSPHTDTINENNLFFTVNVCEVVIHGGESFLKSKNIQICDKENIDRNGNAIVTDYSTGWQHTMLLMG